jgi:hypothetical protein
MDSLLVGVQYLVINTRKFPMWFCNTHVYTPYIRTYSVVASQKKNNIHTLYVSILLHTVLSS